MSKNSKKSEPMDTAIREKTVGTPATNRPRNCWAIKQLVAEFTDLFPETTWETSNTDGRNTNLDVTFDLTPLGSEDRATAESLLELLDSDIRVGCVIAEDDRVLVSMQSSPRTQDNRDSFGLHEAFEVLIDGEESDGTMDPMFYADLAQQQERGSW